MNEHFSRTTDLLTRGNGILTLGHDPVRRENAITHDHNLRAHGNPIIILIRPDHWVLPTVIGECELIPRFNINTREKKKEKQSSHSSYSI